MRRKKARSKGLSLLQFTATSSSPCTVPSRLYLKRLWQCGLSPPHSPRTFRELEISLYLTRSLPNETLETARLNVLFIFFLPWCFYTSRNGGHGGPCFSWHLKDKNDLAMESHEEPCLVPLLFKVVWWLMVALMGSTPLQWQAFQGSFAITCSTRIYLRQLADHVA